MDVRQVLFSFRAKFNGTKQVDRQRVRLNAVKLNKGSFCLSQLTFHVVTGYFFFDSLDRELFCDFWFIIYLSGVTRGDGGLL